MIEQQGRVLRLQGNRAEIQIGVSSGCSLCNSGKGCGAGIFAQLLRRKSALVQVPNTIEATPGQVVTLAIPENVFLLIIVRLYLLPLAAALAGAAIGQHLAERMHVGVGMSDAVTFLCAAVFFVLLLYLCRQQGREWPHRMDIELIRPPDGSGNGTDCQKSCQLSES